MKKNKEKDTNTLPTVKEIHNAFYKEAIMPVTEAQVSVLKETGFNMLPPAECSKLFPFHKVIHLNKILLLCEKYNLVFSETENYVGSIPQKNLYELEQFTKQYNYFHLKRFEDTSLMKELFGIGKSVEEKTFEFIKNKHLIEYDAEETIYEWRIVASKDMVVTKKIRKNRIVVPDPIIIGMIKPHWGAGGMRWWDQNEKWGVIVTAWGDEASDEIVVNERNN